MKLLKKGWQKNPNILGKVTGEYEIRTFKGNQRVRSPIAPQFQTLRRSPNIQKGSQKSDSNLGEMFYMEPNDTNFRRVQNMQNMSPLNDSNNINMRSPLKESNYENIQGNIMMPPNNNLISNQNYFMNNNNFDNSRSPNRINIGESPQENDYTIKSINRGQNIFNQNSPLNNNTGDRSYNMILNDTTGNIFLDQPMQQVESNQINENSNEIDQIPNPQNQREILFPMNPRDYQEPSPGILRKMSPKQNVEGDSDSNSEKNDNVNEINDLKTQLDKNMHVMLKNEDGVGIGDKNLRNRGDIENIELMAKAKEFQDNTNSDNVKKLIKYYVKTYDPRKGEDGNLISNYQVIIPSNVNQDGLFNERYKVLQKMNKLSNILLSKRKGSHDSLELNRSFNESESPKKKFDRNTLTNAKILDGKSKVRTTNRKNKFLYVSLAMLSAKGPNTEDRTIFRKMRLDKGGVVDLAQESIQKKSKFKIKRARTGGRGITAVNPKYREKAAKVVQMWWRERKQKYKRILEQIIKIQSFWRGKFTRKYIYDVIYISYLQEKFLSIMRGVLVNHIRPYVFNELFSKNKLIKNVLGDLLTKVDEKNILIKLQEYLYKWRAASDLIALRLYKSKQLLDKKEKDTEKLSILKKYFDKWAIQNNLSKYIGEAKNAEEKRKKFFGTLNIVNGLSSITKRQIFKSTKGPITNYLKDLLRQKLLLKITKKICTRCLQNKLRGYLNKWRINTTQQKFDDFKKEEFIRKMNHINSNINKNKVKDGFNKLKALIPKYKDLLKIKNGFENLEKSARKKHIQFPIKAIKEKLDKNNKQDSANKFLLFKKRNLNANLRQFFNDWKNKKMRLEDKDKRNEVYNHLLKNIINKIQKRILYKKFNQWRKKPDVDVKSEMQKINNFINLLNKGVNKAYNDDRKTFLDNLNKTRDKHALNNATKKIYDIINEKRKIILKYYLYKIRSDLKNEEIKDLHKQLLKYIISFMNMKNNRNKLSKCLSKWKLFIEGNKNNDYLNKLKSVLKGGDFLDKIYKRRNFDLMKRLYQKMNKDHRPKILKNIIQKLDKPRSTLNECFNKWRRITDLEKANNIILKYKGKIMQINANNIKNKNDRNKLLKAFFHWKAMIKKPEEYYPKINNLLNIIKKNVKNCATNEPFNKIKNSRNPQRYLLKLIKNRNNQNNRLLEGQLRNLLGRWRRNTVDNKASELKTKILYNLKNYMNDTQKKKLLSKYFTKWRAKCAKKELNINFLKGINQLTNILRKKLKPDIHEILNKKTNDLDKKNKLNNLVIILQKLSNNNLHDAFLNLWKNALKIDPERDNKIKTKLNKIIKNNDLRPKSKAFKRWLKSIHLFELKDKDKYHAIKLLINLFKNHDKMNIIRALNLWKERLYKIREQYLKALLIKQIKTSQKAKEKMSKENKLRMALLRWRSNIISMNYLDNLKKIRRGCKLLKLGVKKMHEKNIFDNMKELLRQNDIKNNLEKLIDKMNIKLNNEKEKNAFNKWKKVLDDIKKEKFKIKNLFEKYINTDKMHQNIFEKPKIDIINLAKNYDDKRNKAAKKIIKFVKRIIRMKDNNEKMERNKLLNKIVQKKINNIDYLKKINLKRFHRQAENIKIHENARKIQRFIRVKLRKYMNKKNLIKEGLEKLDLYIKRKEFDKIKNKSNNKLGIKLLKLIVEKKDSKNNDLLRNRLKQWNDNAQLDKKINSIIKIQSAMRKSFANDNLQNMKKKNILLKKIHDNNENKNNIRLSVLLRDWLHKALIIRNNNSAKKIQDEYKKYINNKKEKDAKGKLRNIFIKDFKHIIAKILEKTSRITGNKGDIMYKTLQNLLFKKPFDKLTNNMQFLGKLNGLKKIYPKIFDKIKNNILSKTLKKWKENTYDETIKYAKILQNYLREQYNLKLKVDKEKKESLLKNILNRKIKNNLYKLSLPFKIWHKKTKLDKLNENVIKLQNNFRKKLSKDYTNKLRTANKFMNLVNNIKTKRLLDLLNKVKDTKILEKEKKTKLNKIILKKDSFNNKTNLGKYFDKWKKISQISKNKAIKIENAFRLYLAKKKRDNLKDLKNILSKYIIKKDKTNNDLKKSKLRKWLKTTKLIKIDEKAGKIQNFFKPILAKMRNDKNKEFFICKAKKMIYKTLLNLGKINKLNKKIKRIFFDKLINDIKQDNNDKKKKSGILNGSNILNEKIKNILTKTFIKKWKYKNKENYSKNNKAALQIQKNYKGYLAKKEKNRLLNIKQALANLVNKKDKIANNKLCSILRKWNNLSKLLNFNDKAKTIQKQWNKFQDKVNKDKELENKLKIKNGLDKLLNIKFGGKYFIDKIKSASNKAIFNKFNDLLIIKRKDNLKEPLDNIKKKAFNNTLKKAVEIQPIFKNRIIKKALLQLKDKTDKLAKLRAVEKIIKNLRIYRANKKEKNDNELLRNILKIKKDQNLKAKKHYFNIWHNLAMNLRDNELKGRIAKYFDKRYKIYNSRNNWNILCNKLKNKIRNNKISEIINKLKQYKTLNKINDNLINIAIGKVIEKLIKNNKEKNISNKLRNILPKMNTKNNNKILTKYLSQWKNITNKLNQRENKFKNALNIMDRRQIINSAIDINNSMLIKKCAHDIPLVRAKLFLQKIKNKSDNINKLDKLKGALLKAKNELDKKDKKKALNKIYKIYFYNKINNNLLKTCDKYQQRIKNNLGRDFIDKLKQIKTNKSAFNYNNELYLTSKPKTTKLKFKKICDLKNNKDKIISDKNAPMRKVLPSLINYLNNKIRRRKEDAFEKIKKDLISKNFSKIFTDYIQNSLNPKKLELINQMKRDVKYAEIRPKTQIKLFKLFRKKYIKYITSNLVEPSRLYRLYYLCNMSKMHINIASQRYYRELIRKWRFITFSKKMTRKKLELMYKNLHASYLQMADEIFGEDQFNPSVFKEFERFGANIGMFTGQEPAVDEELNKKYYSTVDKRYVFTTKASGKINEVQNNLKEEFEDKLNDGQNIDINPRVVQSTKNIKEQFDSIKKSGIAKNYFTNK